MGAHRIRIGGTGAGLQAGLFLSCGQRTGAEREVGLGDAGADAATDRILLSVLASLAGPPDPDALTARILAHLSGHGLLPGDGTITRSAPDTPDLLPGAAP